MEGVAYPEWPGTERQRSKAGDWPDPGCRPGRCETCDDLRSQAMGYGGLSDDGGED